ncbi:hypothetical protein LEMLEM_LOCUS7479 [Lemmus lemmus]
MLTDDRAREGSSRSVAYLSCLGGGFPSRKGRTL